MKPFLASLSILLLATMGSPATLNRGVWFWGDGESPYGSKNIVGVSALENATISFFQSYGIKRIYGSYQNRSVVGEEPEVIADWNEKLQAAGIQSQCLFSNSNLIFPGAPRADLLDKILARVIDFNDGRPVAEKFDAIHLDLEPHSLTEWKGIDDPADPDYPLPPLTPAEKRQWLLDLRDTYIEIRALLVTEGLPTFPVYADLPSWFDKYPGGQVGWLSPADRDMWFSDIMVPLTGITMMPFQQTSQTAVTNSMSWEQLNIGPSKVRVGHMADVGGSGTWATVGEWVTMRDYMESTNPGRAVDIQSYKRLREALNTLPLVEVSIAVELADPSTGGLITWPIATQKSYIVMESVNLCNWHQVKHVTSPQRGRGRHTFEVDAPRKFWKVMEVQEPR